MKSKIWFSAAFFAGVVAPHGMAIAQQSGAAALGATLGSRTATRQRAYDDEQARMLQNWELVQEGRAAMAQSEAARQQAQAEAMLQRMRDLLRRRWIDVMGMDDAHASAIADAYHFSDDEAAVTLSVQGQTPQQVGAAIRKALDDRNYELANEILIGALLESERRQQTAPASAVSSGG